jgi:hypothetical protein
MRASSCRSSRVYERKTFVFVTLRVSFASPRVGDANVVSGQKLEGGVRGEKDEGV